MRQFSSQSPLVCTPQGDSAYPEFRLYYSELQSKYRTVRRFLPMLLEHVRFGTNVAGEPLVAALDWLRGNVTRKTPASAAPREVVGKAWQSHVFSGDHGGVDVRAYTFCVLNKLQTSLKRRDVFVAPSWRYADPRAGLLDGAEWQATRPIICRTLGLSVKPEPMLAALASELDLTYRGVAVRLPDNKAVRFETVAGKQELVLSTLDMMQEPASLAALHQ